MTKQPNTRKQRRRKTVVEALALAEKRGTATRERLIELRYVASRWPDATIVVPAMFGGTAQYGTPLVHAHANRLDELHLLWDDDKRDGIRHGVLYLLVSHEGVTFRVYSTRPVDLFRALERVSEAAGAVNFIDALRETSDGAAAWLVQKKSFDAQEAALLMEEAP